MRPSHRAFRRAAVLGLSLTLAAGRMEAQTTPISQALGNTVQTDLPGLRYIMAGDRTAVLVDARTPDAFARGSLPKAVNIRKGEAEAANEDGRLPYKDKGTPVIVFGQSAAEARTVAEEIARKAYWNSSYFGGS